jgi:hypothetical protein
MSWAAVADGSISEEPISSTSTCALMKDETLSDRARRDGGYG